MAIFISTFSNASYQVHILKTRKAEHIETNREATSACIGSKVSGNTLKVVSPPEEIIYSMCY
ncbi:2024_t:CDS:2 [Funneliformis caledonium]|uniref:2024_t:CDS:1 n=1 Tax=Funneliformis caledonium TaxID=1117310 RepID=A0A9N9CXQ6_9GLOM|nr:2024_t:CDS:2 [Funneliformis caledonium]